MPSTIVNVTDSNFEAEVLKAKELVLVDFWAEWCGPCKVMGKNLEELVTKLNEEGTDIKIAKINIDENNDTAVTHGIRSIPTLIIFDEGQKVAIEVGLKNVNDLYKLVKDYL